MIPPTEAVNPGTRGLDMLDTHGIVEMLAREQGNAAQAVAAASSALGAVVDAIVVRLRSGGTLHYVGAGTSGRLGMLDAAECPPTFGTPPSLVVAHIAGGERALVRAIEGAEDDAAAGAAALHGRVGPCDAVVGISASGGAPYVVAAIETARVAGALTIALSGNADSPLGRAAEMAVTIDAGPEPIAGSTRLKAGTVAKLALNAISTATMIRLGKVYDNLMVDVVATNVKLHERAMRLVRDVGGVNAGTARELLAAADGSVKVAIVMARRNVDSATARRALAEHDGFLRPLLDGVR
ncbi:MAG: N-acetylmuramic acid 6-phosphate etherase [Candidatus Eremiobacteraeota bacterium]|nr:N-acetylmuramic acid 6-phosphate etherase [Candidatus Eremiobacteraeota bacterium]MBC5802495.1 N-acetylmuramic acid 6-phosphate etherase [Candidatus Eremiobacteraeota bacterium]MBC5821597.1 N-acetylmuramic acid 6-phosphate etherase [Candidatus Eremiobacteraeota bacterium]